MSNGAHALTEADLAAVREVWDTMDAANNASDWDTYQQHLTQDLVALDPRIAGPLRGRTAWREWIDSIGLSDPEVQLNVEEISGSGDVACIFWTGERPLLETALLRCSSFPVWDTCFGNRRLRSLHLGPLFCSCGEEGDIIVPPVVLLYASLCPLPEEYG